MLTKVDFKENCRC